MNGGDTSYKPMGFDELEAELSKQMGADEAMQTISAIINDEHTRKVFDALANDKEAQKTIENMLKSPVMLEAVKNAIKDKNAVKFIATLLKNTNAMESGLELIADAKTRDEFIKLVKGDIDANAAKNLLDDEKTQKLFSEINKDKDLMRQIRKQNIDIMDEQKVTIPNDYHDTDVSYGLASNQKVYYNNKAYRDNDYPYYARKYPHTQKLDLERTSFKND
ncbi:hypothetical protein L0F63_000651 [Massospora cicadina]|nr:hypothetical protein L0F63_000651 [Massospora cicadina]